MSTCLDNVATPNPSCDTARVMKGCVGQIREVHLDAGGCGRIGPHRSAFRTHPGILIHRNSFGREDAGGNIP